MGMMSVRHDVDFALLWIVLQVSYWLKTCSIGIPDKRAESVPDKVS
jgi:hypothetical protein